MSDEEREPTYEELLESNRVLSNIIVNQNDRLANGARGLLAQGWDEGYSAGKGAALDFMFEAEGGEATNPYRDEPDLLNFEAVLAEHKEEGR